MKVLDILGRELEVGDLVVDMAPMNHIQQVAEIKNIAAPMVPGGPPVKQVVLVVSNTVPINPNEQISQLPVMLVKKGEKAPPGLVQ